MTRRVQQLLLSPAVQRGKGFICDTHTGPSAQPRGWIVCDTRTRGGHMGIQSCPFSCLSHHYCTHWSCTRYIPFKSPWRSILLHRMVTCCGECGGGGPTITFLLIPFTPLLHTMTFYTVDALHISVTDDAAARVTSTNRRVMGCCASHRCTKYCKGVTVTVRGCTVCRLGQSPPSASFRTKRIIQVVRDSSGPQIPTKKLHQHRPQIAKA